MAAMPILYSIALLTLANGSPVVAKKLFGPRFAFALDGGFLLFDGRPVFGASKTVRGIVASIAVTAVGGVMLGLGYELGALMAIVAMAGDLLSSFLKRRMNMPPSSQALGLDQVPESLFPLLACRESLGLSYAGILVIVLMFFVGELAISRLLYVLRIRDQPY
ncbi:CDP-archaeol synthase [Bradyrhizobium arachidis]|uniref:CDP-archaeol synthase n=1 Tax=Bradyrhizobium TaxID=374 RepID=UPI0021613409|nr:MULTISPECIES: CDP-archaeol synthase [Bradyrhizobium]MDN4983025.1 CDP-archaeol synthase [Bradyrhizobium sp. WYCCWR 13022]UVO34489.1 CDP-archaeol synthase [Bradyrhizobium arachidis]